MPTDPLSTFEGKLDDAIGRLPRHAAYGRIAGVSGLMATVGGLKDAAPVGARLKLIGRQGVVAMAEVVGFKDGQAQVLAFDGLEGVGLGVVAELETDQASIRPSEAWLGRVIGPMGFTLFTRADWSLTEVELS